MTVILLLLFARALRASPHWPAVVRAARSAQRARAAQWCSPLLLLLPASLLVGCASLGFAEPDYPERLPVFPADSVTVLPGRPAEVLDVADALAGCSGVQRVSTSFEFACVDQQYVYVTRLAAEAERCSALLLREIGDAAVRVMDLPLPDAARAYRSDAAPLETASLCSPHPNGGVVVAVVFGAPLTDVFYRRVLAALAYSRVPAHLITYRRPDEVDFLGRTLQVHPSCELMAPQNLACYGAGQMDWAAFSTLEGARAAVGQRIRQSVEAGAKVVGDDRVSCWFEGRPSECRRVTYDMPIPRWAAFGQSVRLVAYYAAERRHGTNGLAVCSFYDDQVPPGRLPALCLEAFSTQPLLRAVP